MSKAAKIVLAIVGTAVGLVLLAAAAFGLYWFLGPTCYRPAMPLPNAPMPRRKEALRDELLRDLAETGKLPAKVVIRARRSGRP